MMQDTEQNFTALSVGLSKLLAHAVLDNFPKAQLIGETAQDTTFCYKFILNAPFEKDHLELIENRMIEVKSQGIELYKMEMMPKNAIELFRHHNQPLLEESLHEIKDTIVSLVRMNEYYDLVQSDFEDNLDKAHFRLTHFEQEDLGDGFMITLFGLGAENANHLKKRFKEYKELQKNSHVQQGIDQKLFEKIENDWFFYPKGAKFLETLKGEVEREFEKENFQMISHIGNTSNIKQILEKMPDVKPGTKYFLWDKKVSFKENPLDYGLFKINSSTYDQWISVVNKEQIANECISCLKFYLQIIKILGFSYRVECTSSKCPKLQKAIENILDENGLKYEVVEGPAFKLEFKLLDRFGRSLLSPYWTIDKIASKKSEDYFVFLGSICTSYEKLLAKLLEEHRGKMPLRWCPVQLKILSLREGSVFAQSLYDYFQKNSIEVTIDSSTEKLGARLRQAFIEKVPRIAIVGQKEQEEGKLVVKLQRLNKEIECSKEELLEHILEELMER